MMTMMTIMALAMLPSATPQVVLVMAMTTAIAMMHHFVRQ